MVQASDHTQHAGKSKSNTPGVTTALLKLGHLHLLEGSELHDALQDETFYESVKKDLVKRMAST